MYFETEGVHIIDIDLFIYFLRKIDIDDKLVYFGLKK